MMDFSIGSILGRSFSIFGKNIASFLVLGVLLHLPSIYIVFDLLAQIESGNWDGETSFLPRLIGLLSGQLLAATLIYGTVMELRGMHAGVGKCIQVGLVRALPVLLTAIVAGLAIVVGFVLLIVPGIIVMTILYVAIPVAVVERPGIMASLSRSSELTSGYRMRIFGLVFIIMGAAGLINYLISKQVTEAFFEDPSSIGTLLYAATGIEIVVAILGAIISAVVYHDLRAIKDGVNIDELAAVFE
tara:strand:+ start:89172 stop:89903 length:732 start_codon:yes stop_codon:yes gene_type:complete